jgi:hypothetical protein
MPLYPFIVLRTMERAPTPCPFDVFNLGLTFEPLKELGMRQKPSKCFTCGFSSLKKMFRASQTWKLPVGIYIHWKVLRHSMRRLCNRFLQNLKTCTLC